MQMITVLCAAVLVAGCAPAHPRYNLHSDYCKTNMIECASVSPAVQMEMRRRELGIETYDVTVDGKRYRVRKGPRGTTINAR